jgi:hypothetical protein
MSDELALCRSDAMDSVRARLLQISYTALRYKIVECGLARWGPSL